MYTIYQSIYEKKREELEQKAEELIMAQTHIMSTDGICTCCQLPNHPLNNNIPEQRLNRLQERLNKMQAFASTSTATIQASAKAATKDMLEKNRQDFNQHAITTRSVIARAEENHKHGNAETIKKHKILLEGNMETLNQKRTEILILVDQKVQQQENRLRLT